MDEFDLNGDAPPIGTSALRRDRPATLRLLPEQPPGRSTRKALPFADEICRLHAMGYTLEAIREALRAVGVSVSRSTVHREVRRSSRQVPLGIVAPRATPGAEFSEPASLSEMPLATRVRDSPRSDATDRLPCKEDAEAFFAAHESNPLFTTKETS
ncbi:MAG: hypothetical protein RIQ60_2052 [Pseudomonadota bacterium]